MRWIPLFLMIFILVAAMADFFFRGISGLPEFMTGVRTWNEILYAFSLTVGFIAWIRYKYSWYKDERLSWGRRIESLGAIAMFIFIVVGGLIMGTSHPIWMNINTHLNAELSMTAYGLIGIFECIVVYRLIKMRTWESTIFALVVFLWLLTNTPLTIYIVPGAFELAQWVLTYWSGTGGMVLAMLTTIGAIGMGVRAVLGLEKGILSGVTAH